MKLKAFFLVCLMGPASGWAQQSEVRDVGSFRGLKSGEAIDVYLKKGEKESVKVEVTGERLSNVLTEVSGSSLRIQLRNNSFFQGRGSVKVYVTYVNLDRISASSASNVFSEGPIKCTDMEIHASSAADVEVTLDAETVVARASSAAEVILSGKAKSIDADASSSGDIDAYNLPVVRASADASSAGGIKLNVSEDLRATASSGGSVRYRGNPLKTNTNASSGGSVKKSN